MALLNTHNASGPHLPNEILFRVVDFIPMNRILSFRSVCSSFRDHINTHVMYSYLQRIRLVACLDVSSPTIGFRNDADLASLRALRASFSHVDNATSGHTQLVQPNIANWAGSHAIFNLDAQWLDTFARMAHRSGDTNHETIYETFSAMLQPRASPASKQLGWFLEVDGTTLDLYLGTRPQQSRFDLNLSTGKLKVAWRTMLKTFLRTASEIERRSQEHHPQYTFDQQQDCIRTVLRERHMHSLNSSSRAEDRHMLRAMRALSPLYGGSYYDGVLDGTQLSPLMHSILTNEHRIVSLIMHDVQGILHAPL